MQPLNRRSFLRRASATIGGLTAFVVFGSRPIFAWTGNCQRVSEIPSGTSGCRIQWGPPDP